MNKAQTKAELIATIAAGADISKAAVAKVLDVLADTAGSDLENGREFALPRIGKIGIVVRKPRQARNLRTGETFMTAEKKAPKFTPVKELKERANA